MVDGKVEPAGHSPEAVTLIEGSAFCVSGRSGDIEPTATQGLFLHDTRVLSQWRLELDGARPEPLTVVSVEPYAAVFLSRVPPSGPATQLFVERRRFVGQGMREDVVLRNLGATPVKVAVRLAVGADLAGLFEVKDRRAEPRREVSGTFGDGFVAIGSGSGDARRGVRVSAQGATAEPGALALLATIAPRSQWRTSFTVTPVVGGKEVPGSFSGDDPHRSQPALRMRGWCGAISTFETDDGLQRTLDRSREDLGALRIVDPDHVDEVAVAAGAPWFMALFGRDSLLTSYLSLVLGPRHALGTLRALARRQGSRVDPSTEEEPGRILHEARRGVDFPLAPGGSGVYYGTADATPLFVVLLAELARWGVAADDVSALLPHADRALQWVETYGDRDGDGFVEYERMTPNGLVNQGWKDSYDAISFADGRLARPPLALCEVQGYAYAAYRARAELAEAAGDTATARHLATKADRLKAAFNDRFWLADEGWFAVSLDADKRPVDSLTSNIGHCLWSGIVDESVAPQVAERLMSPEMFSGWGVRTLATSMGAYNPMSYHNGSVWPHDSALVATGLMRYGFVESAQQVAAGVLDAAECFEGRLPELLCGFDRSQYPTPIAYPTTCSPQAWASAAPLQLIRILAGLEPAMPRRLVELTPAWPRGRGVLTIDGLVLGAHRTTLSVDANSARLSGLPDDIEVVPASR